MRILRNKAGLIGLLGLMAALAACATDSVRFSREGGNPPFRRGDYAYPEDGVQQGDVFRVCFDARGTLYPDPAESPVDDRELQAGRNLLPRNEPRDERAAEALAARINRHCAGSRTLVILIHGCNNSYPEARRSYELARLVLRDRMPGARLAFLEIYWDALHGDPIALWGAARENSKWVGLGLRRLLRRLDPGLSLRVITHSRGASVIASAVWTVPLREDAPSNERYRAAEASTAVADLPDLRIGLLVPAMPPADLADLSRSSARVDRVIVGVNEDDPAVGKGFLPATWFGDTSLGCSLQAFRDEIAPRLNASKEVAFAVDLSASEVHDFKDYLLRRAFTEEFLPRLFERPGSLGGGE